MGDNNKKKSRIPFFNPLSQKQNRVMTPDQMRAESCMKAIDEAMRKFNCRSIPQITINGEGMMTGIMVIVPNVKKVIHHEN